MGSQIDFNRDFGQPKILKNKKLSQLKPQIHPDFIGVFNCADELFSALNHDLNSYFQTDPFLPLWKDSEYSGYYCVHDLARFYHFSQLQHPIDLYIYNYPHDPLAKKQLKLNVGYEFLNFLGRFSYQLSSIHPKRLQALINRHIPSECLLQLNKEHSYKPHKTIGLEALAKALKFTEKQFLQQIKRRERLHKSTLDQLERQSPIAKAMLNDSGFVLTPDLIWTSL